ncbi:MAG: hypothetical protein IPP13_12070 [Kouleothrix sp.]|nr:hypothetical protein [Kouleothrix sp.]
MIVQILAHTPIWVYPLFLLLVVFGFIQTRTRTVRRVPALLLPAGMSVLSLAGIISSFGLTTIPLAAWGMALTMATVVGYTFFRDPRIQSKAADGTFFIPGSWVPLAVMMAIFFTKYLYAVMHAFNPAIFSTPLIIGTLSAVYGLYSGYFSSRTVTLIKLAQQAQHAWKPSSPRS